MLVMNERRQRISAADSAKFLVELDAFPIQVAPIRQNSNATVLARQYGLTVYDAAYLELAIRERLPLATLDKALRIAAELAGISLLT